MCEVELGGKILQYNYNRVSKFTPWDELTMSTSTWNTSVLVADNSTETQLTSKNEEIIQGDIILFQLKSDTHSKRRDNSMYGVGKVTTIVDGWINFQWMGSYTSNHTTPYLLGWVDTRDNKEIYSNKRLSPSHNVFDNESTKTYLKAKNILFHGNQVLKSDGRLTKAARAIMNM